MKFLYCLVLLCGLAAGNNAYSQQVKATQAQSKIASQVDDIFKKSPQEKLFVHTAQDNYAAGQTIWYKIYAMAYGKPSELSKIVYLSLCNAAGKALISNKHLLKYGGAGGNMVLPDTLHTGWYQLQGYTAWMLNDGTEGIYHRQVFIINPREKTRPAAPAMAPGYKVTFYPEGGDLADGFENKIAFKAVNSLGVPVQISGKVLINSSPSNIVLITQHDGMGVFKLETYSKDKYQVEINYPDGSTGILPLPAINKSGVGLAVKTEPEFISVFVRSNFTARKNYMIFAMQADGTSTTYPLLLQKGTNEVRFRKAEFSEGIVRFTVFDDMAMPVAERIFFINKHTRLNVLLKDSLRFAPGSSNSLSFNIAGLTGIHSKSNFSVSVTDAAGDSRGGRDIISDLLLSSELRGPIDNPVYYFSNTSDSLKEQLDLVMLTHGWRHFTWERIVQPRDTPLKYQPEKSQFAAGVVQKYDPAKFSRLKLLVINPDSSKRFLTVKPDTTGLFLIDDTNLAGRAQIYYSGISKKEKTFQIKIKFSSSVIDSVPLLKDSSFYNLNSGTIDTLSFLQNAVFKQNAILLREVSIKALRKTPAQILVEDHVKNLRPDVVYDLDLVHERTVPSMSIIDYIKGHFPLEIVENGGVTRFRYLGISTIKESTPQDEPYTINPPVFYVDEARSHLDDIKSISLNDVALIRFAAPPVWFAPLNGGISGALLIYTKSIKDNSAGHVLDPRLSSYVINGFTVQRSFANADRTNYETGARPDYRSTLYWNPDLKPDAAGNMNVKFYNSDHAKHFLFTIEGMDEDGHLGSYTVVK